MTNVTMYEHHAIWVTWEQQLRNRSMARLLGARLEVILHPGPRLWRYVYCIAKTFLVVFHLRPRVVFAQNPSIVLNLFLLALRPLFGFRLVSDAHFSGLIAINGNFALQKALDVCNRLSDLVLVTNEGHASCVQAIGGTPFVFPDPLPDIHRHRIHSPFSTKSVFFICSFDVDEPYQTAFQAARILAERGFSFHVSGDFRKVGIDPEKHPDVDFLGYISENEFYRYLYSSHVILDLTNNDDCLVCGAYEAMAADKPLVTSDTPCLRRFFDRGTLFTRHESASIADAVVSAYQDRDRLQKDILEWKIIRITDEKKRCEELLELLGIPLKSGLALPDRTTGPHST